MSKFLKNNWVLIAVALFFFMNKKDKKQDTKTSATTDSNNNIDSVETDAKPTITEDILNQDFDEINPPRFDMSNPNLNPKDDLIKTDFHSC